VPSATFTTLSAREQREEARYFSEKRGIPAMPSWRNFGREATILGLRLHDKHELSSKQESNKEEIREEEGWGEMTKRRSKQRQREQRQLLRERYEE